MHQKGRSEVKELKLTFLDDSKGDKPRKQFYCLMDYTKKKNKKKLCNHFFNRIINKSLKLLKQDSAIKTVGK